jgi:hypothetical protein
MNDRFYAECTLFDMDSYYKCNYEVYASSKEKNKINKTIIVNINPNYRTDHSIDKLNFIGYCSKGFIPTHDIIIDKIQYESYMQLCKK